jgi:hypothetical protein
MQTTVPAMIDGFEVLEYGLFAEPLYPTGYIPPPDGSPPLEAVQNVAICRSEGIEGYYLLFCTPDWRYVTYSYNETMGFAKRCPEAEFGQPVICWHKLA